MSETEVLNDRDILLARAAEICRERGAYSKVLLKNKLGICLLDAESLIEELKAQDILGKGGKSNDGVEDVPSADESPVAVLKEVALADITPSPLNARRMAKTSQEKMEELVASIKESGLGTPIMLWQPPRQESGFEIVYGERRFQAVSQLGWETIPAIVRHFDSEEEAHEMRLIENMQREDLPPLEEAEGLGVFLAKGMSVEDIAKKIGKAKSYVYSRINIAKLSPRWVTELNDPESDYAKFAEHITWLEEITRLDHDSQDWLLEQGELRHAQTRQRVRELVRAQLMVIAEAPWDDEWEKNQPQERICATCPYRSDAVNLFQDPELDEKARCCRPTCWESKKEEWLTGMVETVLTIAKARSTERKVGFYTLNGWIDRDRMPKIIRERTADWPVVPTNEFSTNRNEAVNRTEHGEFEVVPCVLLDQRHTHGRYVYEGFLRVNYVSAKSEQPSVQQVNAYAVVEPALEKLSEIVGEQPAPSLQNLIYLLVAFGEIGGNYFNPDEEPKPSKLNDMWSELAGDIQRRINHLNYPTPTTPAGLQRLCGWLELSDDQVSEIMALVVTQED